MPSLPTTKPRGLYHSLELSQTDVSQVPSPISSAQDLPPVDDSISEQR